MLLVSRSTEETTKIAPMEFSSARSAWCRWLTWATHRSTDLLLYRKPGRHWGVPYYVLEGRLVVQCYQSCGWRSYCESKFTSRAVLVQSINIPAFSQGWYFGKGMLLIWMLAASCFHWEESYFYESCCSRGFPDARIKAPEQCLTSSWGFCVIWLWRSLVS